MYADTAELGDAAALKFRCHTGLPSSQLLDKRSNGSATPRAHRPAARPSSSTAQQPRSSIAPYLSRQIRTWQIRSAQLIAPLHSTAQRPQLAAIQFYNSMQPNSARRTFIHTSASPAPLCNLSLPAAAAGLCPALPTWAGQWTEESGLSDTPPGNPASRPTGGPTEPS